MAKFNEVRVASAKCTHDFDMYYTYILRSQKQPGAIYIGSSVDLKRRLAEHNSPKSKYYSRRYSPWEVETYIALTDIKQAKTLEKHFKSSSGKALMKKRFVSDSFNVALNKFKNGRNVDATAKKM